MEQPMGMSIQRQASRGMFCQPCGSITSTTVTRDGFSLEGDPPSVTTICAARTSDSLTVEYKKGQFCSSARSNGVAKHPSVGSHPSEIVTQFMDDRQAICSRTSASLEHTLQYSSDKGRCDRVHRQANTLFLVVGTPWRGPEAAAVAAPAAVMAGSAAYPLPEQQRYGCVAEFWWIESSASSTILTKCSRFILYPLN